MTAPTPRRLAAAACACLLAGALCGFALPVPEDWLDRDPAFSLPAPEQRPAQTPYFIPTPSPAQEDQTSGNIITVIPMPEEISPEEDGPSPFPGAPFYLPEEPLTALFLS